VPIALLIGDSGDVRDAVGLYLAGLGWTAVPLPPDPDALAAEIPALAPGLVVVDFRGRPGDAERCVAALADAAGTSLRLLNVPPERLAGVRALAPLATVATQATGLPRAPGAPPPPH
jgi:hypothetical protein